MFRPLLVTYSPSIITRNTNTIAFPVTNDSRLNCTFGMIAHMLLTAGPSSRAF